MNPVNAGLCVRPEDWKWRSDHVTQPSSAASSSTVPVRVARTGGETPLQLAGGDACATHMPDSDDKRHLVSGFHSRGVLPHLKREGGTYFVTFRQAGTLPKEVLLRFKQERDAIIQQHLIRDDEDLHRCCHYTLMNPVNAGLCVRPEDWKWSSGHVAQPSGVAQPSPAASSSTVPVQGTCAVADRTTSTGGGTPPELAGGDACAT